MKTAPLILALSLVANLGLMAFVYSRRADAPPEPTAAATREVADSAVSISGAAASVVDGVEPAADDARFIARFRAEGCPPDVLHALALARVNARYAERLRTALGRADDAYWQSRFDRYGGFSPEQRARMRELNREMHIEVTRILGGEEVVSPYQQEQRERAMGNLPTEKIRQVEAIDRDYRDLMADVRGRGIVLPAQREELRLLEKERRADLAAVLTPEELMEYDLRASPSANTVREKLAHFEPTEAEYRALVKLQLEFDQTYGTGTLSRSEQVRRRAAEQELAQKIATVLTPERLAEYEIVTDNAYRSTDSFVRSYGLEPSIAREIVAVQRDANQRLAALNAQTDLDAAQRATAMAALAQEATAQLAVKLGEVLANYQKASTGSWLRRLNQPPRRPGNAPSQ